MSDRLDITAVDSTKGHRSRKRTLLETQSATQSPGSVASLDAGLPAAAPAPTAVDFIRPPERISEAKQDGGEVAVAIEPAALCSLFGVADPSVATRLLSQLISVIEPDSRKSVDAALIDRVLSLIEGIGPTDTLEAMTATMLVGAQHAALDSLRRASHPDQTPAGRALYLSLSLKAMRTFAQLLETLHQGRGRGVTQQIVVKHVTVEAGAQATLGAIDATTGGRGCTKIRGSIL